MPHAAVALEALKVQWVVEPQEGSHTCQEAAQWKLVVVLEALQVPQVWVVGSQLVNK